jgi:hypothetical protein
MELLQEAVVAFFAAVGMAWLVWSAAGTLFSSCRTERAPCVALIPATGDAPALEQTVSQLQWTKVAGQGFQRILICDCGLDEEARHRAQLLCQQSDSVVLCTKDSAERMCTVS